MSSFEFETWDSGRLTVNRAFAPLFRDHNWRTFADVWSHTANAAIAKKMRTDRITLRFTLVDQGSERAFYIKRHGQSSWKEYVKPLLRLTWPILGARNEWNAILEFHKAGLATMIPVAFGESGSNSFLITVAIENCIKLSEVNALRKSGQSPVPQSRRQTIRDVAHIARSMHRAGLHHQDFYLGHLLRSQSGDGRIYVIDLGRVRKQANLSRRWIVKDLAQLDYSADATPEERLLFLREYLGRRLEKSDRALMDSIQYKKAAIERHSLKNRL